MKKKIAISWSGGKDGCLALHYLLKSKQYEIDHLHTVIGEESKRVGMHGIEKELIEAQATALNIPLKINYLPSDKSNISYEKLMLDHASYCKSKGIDTIAFGDIFLEDLREYREEKMGQAGMKCIFPLWKKSTWELIKEFIHLGYQTKLCAADASKINKDIVGKTITQKILDNFSQDIDPCGENGEFHTFVYDGPIFQTPIDLHLKSIHSHFYEYQIEEEGETKEMKNEFYFAEFQLLAN